MRGAKRAAIGLGGWLMAMAIPVVADGKTDARREALLELRFTENLNLTGRGLDAEVVGDSAILNGTVKTEEDRALAERLVLEMGIRQVDNRLTVEEPPDDKPEKNPALTSEQREVIRRAAAARAREREAQVTPPAAASAPAPAETSPSPAMAVPRNPFETAPIE